MRTKGLTPSEQKLYNYIVDFYTIHNHMPARSYLASILEKDGSVISKQLQNLAIKDKLKSIAPPISYMFK